jgi:hypothetical protein
LFARPTIQDSGSAGERVAKALPPWLRRFLMAIELAPSEASMWVKPLRVVSSRPSDEDINSKYGSRELRIVTESNREQLPNFVEALKRPGWMKRSRDQTPLQSIVRFTDLNHK